MSHPRGTTRGRRPGEPGSAQRQNAGAQVRLQAARPRRPGRELTCRFRGRGRSRRAQILLPEERGRAAGTGPGAYAIDVLVYEGYTPIITPDLARIEVLKASASFPRGPETQIYSIDDTDLCLIATAEITLGGMHARPDPREPKPAAEVRRLSHCFRTEAGRPGRATRAGLYRVHQFTKVEMFVFTLPDQSDAMLEDLLRHRRADFPGAGLAVPRDRHLHRRPGRPGLSQVRSRSLDAGPRRRANTAK